MRPKMTAKAGGIIHLKIIRRTRRKNYEN